MLTKILGDTGDQYGVYYTVYGSLAGDEQVVKSYLWSGPYTDLKTAMRKAEELKESHQGDTSFVVKKYSL
ncbi:MULTISPECIES: hypothetical protein [unclassified Coleofasciculus]|uniref:hypothetical protein n=1 Tax=unclassified Coleofasciculus TaxID=2692782 RepID=UPI00187F43A0|nr:MULTISPECIES: hypothetical protein [unclassified Coleofasciculus]MBE9125650.1 hypothetical protein [Coleofasciculus sp. LEGE 07081]MBE9148804.1 hypothetical protein [Coleofasciculus sp. LEGE 07092]